MTATLVPSVWVDGDEVVIHDRLDRDPGRVHVRVVQMAWHCANQSDGARATVDGRSYHRDVLLMARELVDALPGCENGSCDSRFGTADMGDGVRFCAACCASSAGSIYDDRDAL